MDPCLVVVETVEEREVVLVVELLPMELLKGEGQEWEDFSVVLLHYKWVLRLLKLA
jgi:hypothetical protein